MRAPYEIIADFVVKKPRLVLLLVGLLIITALIGTTFIVMETGSETYLDPDTPRSMLLEEYTETFQSESIMLLVESDDVLNLETLRYLERLEDDISNQRYITGTSSIVSLLKLMNGGTLPQSSAEINAIKAGIPAEISSRYIPSNLLTISVITLEPGLSQETKNSVLDNLDDLVLLSNPPPGVHIVITGDSAFQQQMGEEMGTSMGTLIMIAMVLMVVAVGLFFSHVRYRFLPVGIVASGLILTFGFIGYARYSITMVAIAAFPVLIGVGIDYAINIQTRYDEEARKSSPEDAAWTTITKSGPSILFAMLSTSMGFIALWISPVPMIAGFGVVCVIGVACCYLVALLCIPSLGILLKYQPKYARNEGDSGNGSSHLMERYNIAVGNLAGWIAKHAVPILLICALIGVIGFLMDTEIAINTNEETFVPQDMPALINLKKVSRTMGSTSSLPVYVRGDNVFDIGTIRWMYEFQRYEESHNSKITGSESIASLIVSYNNGTLPTSNPEVTEILARIPEAQKERYVSGKTDAVILFSTVDMENEVAMAMVENFVQEIEWSEPPPGVSVRVTGMGEMFTNLIKEINIGKTRMTILAFVLIFGLLFLIYRNAIKAITPVIPIMMIVGWNGLVMYLLGIDYTPMTATLGSLTIGVASEYTILIMERYYEEKANGLSVIDSVKHATRQIGTAITVSGMTTVFGFAALLASSFNMISNFGLVTVITVGFSLIGAIIVMPAIIVIMSRFDRTIQTPQVK
ncbi:MAG: hydrophobe/amphiphile efflux-3 (HAE3) family transporter [Methanoregulaceae archaeon]|nr:hydrophobe/amphiphile efflux-3 (HAE3) family transporter [Methanoregulaceae archaeon]